MVFDNNDINRKRIELDLPLQPSISTNILGFEGVLAGETGHKLSKWLAKEFNQDFNEYDKAIDAVYNASHIGGSQYHHLIDGQHDIWGAFEAAKGVHADDSFAEEILGSLEHLARDVTSISGINPFFSLTPDQFSQISEFLSSFGISKSYFADALMVNGIELLGGAIALCGSVILNKKIQQGYSPQILSRLAGGCLLSSVVAANSALFPVAAYGMYKAFKQTDCRLDTVKAAANGSLVSGSSLMISSLIGGPIWLGCIVGVITASVVAQGLIRPTRAFEQGKVLVVKSSEIYKAVRKPIEELGYG